MVCNTLLICLKAPHEDMSASLNLFGNNDRFTPGKYHDPFATVNDSHKFSSCLDREIFMRIGAFGDLSAHSFAEYSNLSFQSPISCV